MVTDNQSKDLKKNPNYICSCIDKYFALIRHKKVKNNLTGTK